LEAKERSEFWTAMVGIEGSTAQFAVVFRQEFGDVIRWPGEFLTSFVRHRRRKDIYTPTVLYYFVIRRAPLATMASSLDFDGGGLLKHRSCCP
jgi:hypothetical protein